MVAEVLGGTEGAGGGTVGGWKVVGKLLE